MLAGNAEAPPMEALADALKGGRIDLAQPRRGKDAIIAQRPARDERGEELTRLGRIAAAADEPRLKIEEAPALIFGAPIEAKTIGPAKHLTRRLKLTDRLEEARIFEGDIPGCG